ncbi:ABC transporter substrate-binding protein [Dactylosporangium sp. NPDC051485]|uniref:ABC transporter substrate-binding protein n=1 Tax=Dactylosporangium sp. NPDC051485 TaxID=3154846 RepID=UPI003431FB20
MAILMKNRLYRALGCAALVGTLTVAACSSPGGGGTQAAGSGQSSSARPSVSPPSGEPIVIATVSQDSGALPTPQTADGIEAWAHETNAKGGLGGRPIEVRRCDDQNNPTTHQQCARKVIADPSVMAAIGGLSSNAGSVGVPLYDQAGMAYICPTPITGGEMSSASSYCITGGPFVLFATIARFFESQGKRSLAVALSDSASGHATAPLFQKIVGPGMKFTPIYVPLSAPDMTPVATALIAARPDAIALFTVPSTTIPILAGLRSLGNSAKIAIYSQATTPKDLADAGAAADGVYLTSNFPPVSDVKTGSALREGLAATGHATSIGDSALSGYLAGVMFETVVAAIGPGNLTRSSILKYLRSTPISGVPDLPELRLPSSNAPFGLTSVANQAGYLQKVQGGKLVAGSDRITPSLAAE